MKQFRIMKELYYALFERWKASIATVMLLMVVLFGYIATKARETIVFYDRRFSSADISVFAVRYDFLFPLVVPIAVIFIMLIIRNDEDTKFLVRRKSRTVIWNTVCMKCLVLSIMIAVVYTLLQLICCLNSAITAGCNFSEQDSLYNLYTGMQAHDWSFPKIAVLSLLYSAVIITMFSVLAEFLYMLFASNVTAIVVTIALAWNEAVGVKPISTVSSISYIKLHNPLQIIISLTIPLLIGMFFHVAGLAAVKRKDYLGDTNKR